LTRTRDFSRNKEKEEEEAKAVHLGGAQAEQLVSHSTSNASQSEEDAAATRVAVAKRFATERKTDRHLRSVLIDLVRINYREGKREGTKLATATGGPDACKQPGYTGKAGATAGATAASATSQATVTDSLSPAPQEARTPH
jgi:hypothetical protein